MHDQLSEHLEARFHPFLAAFQKSFGCHSALLRLLCDWRKALDKRERIAAILMDLSKTFDWLPNQLFIAKLKAYGLAEEAAKLLESYLETGPSRLNLEQVRVGETF